MHDHAGQPLKLLKPEVKSRFLAAIQKGATYHISCGYAGISYQTFRNYMMRGEALLDLHEEQVEIHPDKIYFEFYCDVIRHEAYTALTWLDKIDKAADLYWQAAAWKLERRHPKEYGRVLPETKDNDDDSSLQKAKNEVLRLEDDSSGRPSSTSS